MREPRAEGTQGLTVAGMWGARVSRSSNVTKAIKTRFYKNERKKKKKNKTTNHK